MDERVRELYSPDGNHRVVIFRRDTGSFYYWLEHYHDFRRDPDEPEDREYWWLEQPESMVGVFDSEATAVKEARANVSWFEKPAC